MSRGPADRVKCPVCGKMAALRQMDGRIRQHSFEGSNCEGGNPPLPTRKGPEWPRPTA